MDRKQYFSSSWDEEDDGGWVEGEEGGEHNKITRRWRGQGEGCCEEAGEGGANWKNKGNIGALLLFQPQ